MEISVIRKVRKILESLKIENERLILEACRMGNVKKIEYILEENAEINLDIFDSLGLTCLMWSSCYNNGKITKLLIDRGAKIQTSSFTTDNALTIALKRCNIYPAISIVSADKSIVNRAIINNITPLHISALVGFVQGTILLVNNGADINATDYFGATPLDIAIINEHHKVALILSKRGAISTNFSKYFQNYGTWLY